MKNADCPGICQNLYTAAAELVEAKAVRTTCHRLRQVQATATFTVTDILALNKKIDNG